MADKEVIKSRLLSKVVVDNVTGCWNWNGGKGFGGYGKMKVDNKSQLTHRVAYRVFIGEIPEDICVCHKCDNPSCVNPDHLFLGTQSDNMKDAYKKGRVKLDEISKNNQYKKGHKAYNRILPDSLVIEIKRMIKLGISPSDIANKLNVKKQVVADIKRGQAYFDIT